MKYDQQQGDMILFVGLHDVTSAGCNSHENCCF